MGIWLSLASTGLEALYGLLGIESPGEVLWHMQMKKLGVCDCLYICSIDVQWRVAYSDPPEVNNNLLSLFNVVSYYSVS